MSIGNFLFAILSVIEPVLWAGFIVGVVMFLVMMWQNESMPLLTGFALLTLICGIGVFLDKSTYGYKNTLQNDIEIIQKDIPKLVPEPFKDLNEKAEQKWEDIKREHGL